MDLDDVIRNGPYHSMGGFNHGALSTAAGNAIYPQWDIDVANIPQRSAVSNLRWPDLVTSHQGAVNINHFPAVGTAQHFRWLENSLERLGLAFVNTRKPVASILASYNPRAVRNDRTPIEHRQAANVDNIFNSLYYSINDTRYGSNNTSHGWQTIDAMAGWPITVGYTDSPDVMPSITENTLFELANGPEYFQSIASLQQASLAPPAPPTNSRINYLRYGADSASSYWNVNSSYPAYPIGNSVAPLAVPLNQRSRSTWLPGTSNLRNGSDNTLYDWSYLLNDYLWDRYFFAEYDSLNNRPLNPRYSLDPTTDTTIFNYNNTALAERGFTEAAEDISIQGAFNVNSTSVDAWRAFLAGTVGATVGSITYDSEAPYLRNLNPREGNAGGAGAQSPDTYAGYRTLQPSEIDSLAREIVAQVKKRGPFTSMAHFVNRVIDAPEFRSTRENTNLSGRERAIGALQAALEKSTVNAHLQTPALMVTESDVNFDQFQVLTALGSKLYGQPGYVTQADILSRTGAALTARSDTFKIRAYGEDVNPVTGRAAAKAWCEMIVQRQPSELSPGTNERPFTIVSFRWLTPDEI